MRREINVLALIKGSERYLYIYDDESQSALLDHLAEQALDPALTINGFDAAVLARRSHEQVQEAEPTWTSDCPAEPER